MAKTKTTKTKKTSSKTKETKLKAKQLQNSVESSIELSKKQYSLSSSKAKSIEYGKVPEVKKANLPQEEIDSINNELASFYEQLNEKQSKLDKLTFKEQKLLAKQKVEKAKLKYGETKAQLVSEIKLLNNSISKLQKRIYPDGLSKTDYALIVKNFNAFYGSKQALFDVNIYFPKNTITALIGPSGCGKSTFLRSLNRINDEIPAFNATGTILFNDSIDIYKLMDLNNPSKKINISEIRTRIGMIFQQPNPFPMSIYKNVTYGPKINGVTNKAILNKIAQDSLKSAAIWEETKDILNSSAMGLSGGQQQRLCIARAIANQSEILLMDEPTSALDPIASAKIEELILELKKEYTIIFVTHSMQQAARISDFTGFFHEGKLIEIGPTQKIFTSPNEQKTDDYIRGRFG